MRSLVSAAAASPEFRVWASGLDSDFAMDRYLRRFVSYMEKPFQILVRPERMVDEISRYGWTQGNCADSSMLAAAIHKVRGIPAGFVALRTDPRESGFQHVFEVRRDTGAVSDITVAPGTAYRYIERVEVPV